MENISKEIKLYLRKKRNLIKVIKYPKTKTPKNYEDNKIMF